MNGYIKAFILILICIWILIPFSSSDPDGLEKVAETLGVEKTESPFLGLMPDYSFLKVENTSNSTVIAGVIGVFLVLGAALVLGKSLTKSVKQ